MKMYCGIRNVKCIEVGRYFLIENNIHCKYKFKKMHCLPKIIILYMYLSLVIFPAV